MAKNKLTDLRDHLFETIEALKDSEKPMEIKRATAIANVAQAIISSAKLEVQYLKLTGEEGGSEFLESAGPRNHPALPQTVTPRKGLSTGKHLGPESQK